MLRLLGLVVVMIFLGKVRLGCYMRFLHFITQKIGFSSLDIFLDLGNKM